MNNIKYLRNHEKLTIRELSEMCGLSRPVLSRLENEERKPKANQIQILSDFFFVTSDFLLGISDKGIKCICINEMNMEFIAELSKSEFENNITQISKLDHKHERTITLSGYRNINDSRELEQAKDFYNIYSSLMQATDDPKSERIVKAIPTLEEVQKDLIINLLDSWGK